MITLAMVQAGYKEGHIRLIVSPNGDGIACQIGDNWFYFGGQTAEEYKDVDSYKNDIPKEDIIKEIHEVLEDFSTELEDEYIYYDYYLRTHIEENVFTEAPHGRYQPKIVSESPVDEKNMIYTVSLEPGYMVDVKACSENGLVYIMQNQNGNSVYGIAGPDAAFRHYCFDEDMIVNFVKERYIAENNDYDFENGEFGPEKYRLEDVVYSTAKINGAGVEDFLGLENKVTINNPEDLINLLREEYINNGYLYSGSMPFNSLINKGFSRETINNLLDDGLIQKRNCEGLAYELPTDERKILIAKHDLCSVWYEKTGNALLDEIKVEAQDAAAIPGDKSGITVSTIRHENDLNKPDKTTVYSPFSIGQVIQLEYDLPKQKNYTGYSNFFLRPGGVAVGSFIVTDILHNLLVSPRMNMIELQSLDHTFNQVHPKARTMLIFEDVVLKRLKEPSLEEQITAATQKAATVQSANTNKPIEKATER